MSIYIVLEDGYLVIETRVNLVVWCVGIHMSVFVQPKGCKVFQERSTYYYLFLYKFV